ncbi:MAG: ethanolamine ammonia-lyase subunit EutC, partial [Sphingobacteriales bacterium]
MKQIVLNDSWDALREFTQARIALGRAGCSIPIRGELAFKLAHAHARDAVYAILETGALVSAVSALGMPVLEIQSQVTDRSVYLQRPDLGRLLNTQSSALITEHQAANDLVIIIADGLSATAINTNLVPLLMELLPLLKEHSLRLAPVCIASQARVAIGDQVGGGLGSMVSLVLIGERPGLSAADSIGAYITYRPQQGLTDEARNCVSNIRPGGLGFRDAAAKIMYLVTASLAMGYSGV